MLYYCTINHFIRLHLFEIIATIMYNTTECSDSKSYRNPFSGYVCSKHNDTTCVDWIDVLDNEQLDELLENCPESCNLVQECM